MWAFQSPFRRPVEMALQGSLEVLGVTVEPTVFLIGLLREGGSRHPLCVEPEDGPIVPADFEGLRDRATELYHQDPDSKLIISTPWIHEKGQQQTRHRAYGTAISEVLQARLGPGLRFFAGLPTPVDQHLVFTAVGLPEWIFDDTPHLTSKMAAGRYPVTQSLIQGAVDEILRLSSRALYEPHAGDDLDDIGADPADVAKAAGRALTRSATTLASEMGSDMFDGLNRVATTRYERRVGIGSLLVADPHSEHVDRSVTLLRLSPSATPGRSGSCWRPAAAAASRCSPTATWPMDSDGSGRTTPKRLSRYFSCSLAATACGSYTTPASRWRPCSSERRGCPSSE